MHSDPQSSFANHNCIRFVRAVALLLPLLLLGACRGQEAQSNFAGLVLGDAQAGAEALEAYGCGSCHTIPGIDNAEALVGPPLDQWSERHTIAGELANTPANLVNWIMNPQEIEPGTIMPDMGVSEEDARHMAAYLYTLGDGGPALADGWPPQTQEVAQEQPVLFSHELHVSGLEIDCRYCHSSVTESEEAGMPSTHTCMTCHSQVWTDSALLTPVRESWEHDLPLAWVRVQPVPDFVHFDHAAHVNNGIGCNDCHGRVDQMDVVQAAVEMTMSWCLECHRQPERFVRPQDEVFNLAWQPPANQQEVGHELVDEYGIRREILTDCSLCHN
jgi:cytochrome c2